MSQSEPTIATQIVRHVRDCLELTGMASAPILLQHGIRPEVVDQPDETVALSAYVQFFESAASASRNPQFGLQAARLMSANGLGPLSFLFLSAPTLRQAFETFTTYLDAMQEATFNAFEREGDLWHFSYAIRHDAITPRLQDAEYSIGVMCNLLKQYLGPQSNPVEVHFEHQCQGALRWYEGYFGCPVYFEQANNRLYLDASLLDRSSNALSSELFPIIAGHLATRMSDHQGDADVAVQVRDLLLRHSPDALPQLDQVAAMLKVSRATLIRRLRHQGTSFGGLVMDRRIGFASQLLAGSSRTISDIAIASGYAETASFARAFRGRTGQTPRQWRKERQKG
mgnify:CR=1 FL=1